MFFQSLCSTCQVPPPFFTLATFLANPTGFQWLSVIETPDLDLISIWNWTLFPPAPSEPRSLTYEGEDVGWPCRARTAASEMEGSFGGLFLESSVSRVPPILSSQFLRCWDWKRKRGRDLMILTWERPSLAHGHHLGIHILVSSLLWALCLWGRGDWVSSLFLLSVASRCWDSPSWLLSQIFLLSLP